MARGDINEYYDPRHERQMAQMLKDSREMLKQGHLGGIASVMTRLGRRKKEALDEEKRKTAGRSLSKALMAKPWRDPNTEIEAGELDDFGVPQTAQIAAIAPGQLPQGIERATGVLTDEVALHPDNPYIGRDLRNLLTQNFVRQNELMAEERKADRALADKIKFADYEHGKGIGTGQEKFGNKPIWGTLNGKDVLLQPSNKGGLRLAQTPQGVDLKRGQTSKVNLGDRFAILDANGTIIGYQPINLKPGETPEAKATASRATAAGTVIGKKNANQYFAVQHAFDQREKVAALINHLKTSKAITGLGADMLNNIERVKTFLGYFAATRKVTDTEILDVMMGSEVFPMIKALGIGARGMDTPAEREFMRKVLTGSIQLNKATLIRMAEIRANISKRVIEKWNERVRKGDLDTFFKHQGIRKEQYNIKNLTPINTDPARLR